MKKENVRRLRVAVLAMLFCGALSNGAEAAEALNIQINSGRWAFYADPNQFNFSNDNPVLLQLSAKTAAPISGGNNLVTNGQVYSYVEGRLQTISGGGASFKDNLVVEASTDARSTTDTSKKNTLVDTDNKVLATFKTGSIGSGDTGFLSGGTAYAELRPVTSTNYLATTNTTAANLSNLDSAIGKVSAAGNYLVASGMTTANNVAANLTKLDTKIGAEQTGNYYTNKSDSVETKLSALDTAIGAKTSVSGLYATSDAVEAQMEKVGKRAVKSFAAVASTGTTDAQKIKLTTYDDQEATVSLTGEGQVASGDVRLLSGGTAYTELRPVTSTNYLATTNTTAANLSNLDSAIGKVSAAGNYLVVSGMTTTDNVAANLTKLDTAIGKASAGNYIVASAADATHDVATNLTNLDNAIGKVSAAGNYLVVSGMTTTNNIAANLSKLDTAIGKVSGSTHYLTAQDGTASANVATNLKELDDALYDHAKLVKSNATKSATATKILIGNDADFTGVTEISVVSTEGTKRTISGVSDATATGQAATWDQIAASGKTIKLSTETETVGGVNKGQFNQIISNDGTVLATFQKMDKISDTDEGFVSGKDLYKELKVTESGSYVKKSNTTAENLLALDRAVSGGGIVRVGTENKDTIYVGLNPEGETTYSAVTSINIGNGGTRTLKGLASATAAGEAVEFSQINTVTPTQANGSYIQGTLKADNTINPAGTVGANLAALDAKAVSSASGVNAIDLSDTSKKLVSNDGSTLATFTRMAELKSTDYGFVSGADLYNETREGIASTNYISSSTDAGANLSALDAAIGKTAKGKYIAAQDGTTVTVATNLAALDTALANQAKLVRVSDDDTTKILVGSDVSHAGVKTIDVSNSGTTRTISGVSRGTASGQAATWDQIAQEGQTVSLSAATHEVNGKNIQANQIATNDGKLVATFSMMGNVVQNDTGFVSGGNLWAETRQNATGTYIAATSDAGTNLAALDSAIGKVTGSKGTDLHYIDAQGETVNVATNLKQLDAAIYEQARIVRKGVDSDADKILIGNDDAFADVTTVSVAKKDGTARTVTGVAAGTKTGEAATWEQLASDNQGTAYEMDENGVITVSTNAGGEAFKLQISGKGSIADGNAQVIDGGTAYTYLNPTTGSYVESGATTAANLNALDSAIGKVTGGTYISAQGETVSVATNLGELDTALATHAKLVRVGKVEDGENPKTIFVGKDLGDTKYEVDTIDIGNGGTRTITGVAAGTKTGEAATWEQLASDNDGVAYTMDDEGVITVKTNGNADAFKLKISGKGSIEDGDTQVLDGNTVYAYLSPAAEGNYIKPGVDGGKTTAENLTALDSAIGKVTTGGTYISAQDETHNVATNLQELDAAIAAQSKIVRVSKEDPTQILIGRDGADETDFANVTTIDVSNGGTATRKITGVTYGGATNDAAAYGQILKAGQTIQLGLQDGNMTLLSNDETTTLATFTVTEAAVSSGNIGIMTGNAAYNELRNDVSGNYLDKTHTTGQNLSDLSKAIGKVTGSKGTDFHYIDAQDGDAVNVATNLKQLDAAIYEQEKIVRKGADSDADKILIGNDVAFADVTAVSVAKKDGTARTVMGVVAGTNTGEAATWEQLASNNGGDAYEMDADGVITVKTNGNADAFKLKISGDGSIEANSGKLITGGTAYAYLSPAENGNYIRTGGTDGKTTGENLAALDSAIGKVTTGGTYISAQGENVSVATNLQELDAAIAAQSKIVRVSKEDSTQILIGRDGENETDFANVTTIDVSNGGTATRKITGVTYGEAKNDAAAYGQILKAGQTIQLGLQGGNMTLLSNDETTTLATFTVTEAAVSSGNIGIMTGNAAYNELRPTTTGNYISDQTTKANLAALDSAIGVTEAGTYISAQKSQKGGKVVTVATNLAELDKAIATQSKIVRVGGESNEKILIGRDDADETTFANVTTIDVGNAGKSRTVTGVASAKAANEAVEFSQIQTKAGETQANGTYLTSTLDANGNLVAAGTVGANLAALDAKAVSTKEGTNVINLSDTSKKLVSNDGTTLATFTRMASVAGTDFGFVSGADLYNEVRVVGKKGTTYNYIDEGNSTAQNLKALDAAIKEGIGDTSKLIRRDGTAILIGNDTEYADVKSVDVGNGGTRTITGVAAGTNNTDAANVGQLVASGTVDLSATGNKVYTNGDKENALLTFTKMKEVSASDTGFVSGADLYNETRKDISSLTNYISKTASAGANLSTLDAELAKVAKANTDAVAAINADLKVSDGNYLKEANKANANLTALDTAIGKVDKDGNVIKKTYGDDGKFAVSVADNLKNLDDKIGSIAEKTDGTSYTAISKDATVSDNLVALDKAISEGVAADFTKIQNATKYENAKASGENAIALGNQSDASGATGAKAMALGMNASATEENAVALGTKSNASGANALALGNGAAASGEGSVAIGSGSVAKEANVVSVGSEGAERRITNVADGVNDTDAVNVSQLNRSFANMQSELTADINKVGAGAAALSALRPEGFDPTDKISFAVGYGHYRSANAGALGVFYKPNADTTLSLGGTLGNGDSMMSAGVSFKLGSGAKAGIYPTGAALSQEMASLRKNNDKLSADNKSLKKDNAAQAMAIKTQAKQIENLKADNEKIKADNAKMKADNEQMKKQIAMILSKMEMSETVKKTAAK